MKSALLIIDMQNEFLKEYQDARAISSACEVINYVAQQMRERGQMVIHVRDVEDADELPEEALAITAEIDQYLTDTHIEKEYSNAFFETNLANHLNEHGIEFVVLCGQAAEHCVVFTYNGAIENGFKPTVLQEGILSSKPGRVEMLMEDRNVISHIAISMLT